MKLVFLLLAVLQSGCCQKTSWCEFLRSLVCTFEYVNYKTAAYTLNSAHEQVQSIQFKSSRIKIFTPNLCERFPMVQNLDLSGLGIETLFEDALKPCSKLQSLDFSNNKVASLLENGLQDKNELKNLNFSHNQLELLSMFAFKDSPGLERLDLSFNKLQNFHISIPLSALVYLNLEHNLLLHLDCQMASQYIPAVTDIFIAFNKLECREISCFVDKFLLKMVPPAEMHNENSSKIVHCSNEVPVKGRGSRSDSEEETLREIFGPTITTATPRMSQSYVTDDINHDNFEELRDAQIILTFLVIGIGVCAVGMILLIAILCYRLRTVETTLMTSTLVPHPSPDRPTHRPLSDITPPVQMTTFQDTSKGNQNQYGPTPRTPLSPIRQAPILLAHPPSPVPKRGAVCVTEV